MHKYLKTMMGIMLFLLNIYLHVDIVSAAETGTIPKEYTDSESIQVYPMYSVYHGDWLKEDGKRYLFTKESAGRIIPIQLDRDGLLVYCFSSDKVKLLDEGKAVIKGKEDRDELGTDYGGVPIRMISVKKDKKYYIQLPKDIAKDGYEVYAYVHPKHIGSPEMGKTYYSEGTGKYVYYQFQVKKKCLLGIETNPVFITYKKMSFRLQKRIKGKWKDIASVRTKLAAIGQCGALAPYGLSKGKYRFGIKVEKGQVATFAFNIRNIKYKNSLRKSKAVVLKKGKNKKGLFTWKDKKAHWYRVVKSNKNKVKKLTMYAGGAIDKFQFTIYKEGIKNPLKIVKIRGRTRVLSFIEYNSKSYALKENGTYYIKVSKANKKTNGAYKIGVK